MKTKEKSGELSATALKRLQTLICAVVTYVLLFGLLFLGVTPETYDIRVGQPATVTVYATKDVEDTVTTNSLRDNAANAIEPSYKSVDPAVSVAVMNALRGSLSTVTAAQASQTLPEDGKITVDMLEALNGVSAVKLDKTTAAALLGCDADTLAGAVQLTLDTVQDALNSTLPEGTETAAVNRITRMLTDDGYPSGVVSILTDAVRSCLEPNMLIDTEITEANREKAREAVETVVRVKREVIVRQGEIVTPAQYQMISDLGLLKDDSVDLLLIGGLALILLCMFGAIFLYLFIFRAKILHDTKRVLMMCIILLIQVALCMATRELNIYVMPVALCAILITILVDAKTAMFIGSMMSFVVSMLVSSDGLFSSSMFSVMLSAFTAGPVAAIVLKKQTQRFSTLLAGLACGLMGFLVTMSVGFIGSANINTTLESAGWALGGGLLSSVLAIGLQAVLEFIFNPATNAKLIELSNPNQPLLKRLLMEAPGTYHHSIIVANLAEAGTSAVGGNALLARVGAYYHDVGKLKRPMYFKENQMGDNPHDRTDPRVSAAILTAHPRDGVQLAQRAHLPTQIQDIIRQHHGDTPVLFFYDKAVKLYGDDVDLASFRYDGPRPRSKEAAAVMLADTVEAATRALSNPNQERIEQLIRTLIRKKMDDGQLNECDLTFADLDRICLAFSRVLTGVFHERIEYPDITIPSKILSEEELNADLAGKEEDKPEEAQPETAAPETAPAEGEAAAEVETDGDRTAD